jgi:predicted transcriptional regulator
LTGVAERKADRLRVMNEIYAEVGDGTEEFVDVRSISERLGFSHEKMDKIIDYLKGEGLIEADATLDGQMTASITHAGVKEMERSEEHPQEPTDHFPSRSLVINIAGNMIGSAIQSDSAGATQHVDVGDVAVGTETGDQIRKFLEAFDRKLPGLRAELTTEALAEIEPDVATVRAQLNSPKPKKNFIKESLASIRAILESAATGVVTSELLMLLSMIHI